MSNMTAETVDYDNIFDLFADDLPVIAECRKQEAYRAQREADIAAIRQQERDDEERAVRRARIAMVDGEFAETVRLRIIATAAAQDGQVTANDIREWAQSYYREVWHLVDRRFSAQWSALASAGLIVDSGEEEPNTDSRGGNEQKYLPVWKLTNDGWSASRSGQLRRPKTVKETVSGLPRTRTKRELTPAEMAVINQRNEADRLAQSAASQKRLREKRRGLGGKR